ncbi:MAG: hypothetical protein WCY15_10335 [Phenylobacterium sp.]|jgi:hypothetical protein|uniref:hypothetical protein n=1 Tax=Phenylobacterium sp. TaxID=1871053 RepID=UPI002A25E117|nr:hypothetical protein [Phenylobacterium sp.]MDD3837733.1 hypothetical protein [Phenylobacterium sp.]MDX9996989.1 hypothetical protein [Phenylobacterium sp.]
MADENKLQSEGRKANAAQPLNAAEDNAGPERYPSVNQHDAVERSGRGPAVAGEHPSFQPPRTGIREETSPPEDASTDGDDVPASSAEGRLGPGADPAEGKRTDV